MLIGDLVTNNARRNPGGEALIFDARRVTWSQLNARVNRLANGLITLGLRPGDRVAYILGNCIELIELYFAIAKAGGISIGIMPASVGREIAYIAADVGSKIISAGLKRQRPPTRLRASCPASRHWSWLAAAPRPSIMKR